MVSTSTRPSRPRRFAIIGAGGAAGLASLKVLFDELRDYVRAGEVEVVGFEQREDVGGVWYDYESAVNKSTNIVFRLSEPRPDPSKKKWPETPVYDSLTTTVPHPIMFFPSHLAPPSTPLFTGSQTVNDYMRSYVDKFELRKYIQFNAQVTSATWNSSTHQWKVVTKPHEGPGAESVSYFDHLMGFIKRPKLYPFDMVPYT
ncbi:FMO-like domain-containing protein [Rhizoctonia solani AG-1 IA]|uniref:FMO-like domain-containing protein n=1 Tax=Thanatephorus cucumeris (strain AG1-IA) TaxID=983506 RepID=L8WGJ8_THACA|nr:FMO-like domain-containing protein [Rhizoctonia solani AG-1 IA]